jgi:hypothetical protein
MPFSIAELRQSLLADVSTTIAPLVQDLRSASAILPVLVDAEHKRRTAIQERIAQIDCEIEEAVTRRDANVRRLASPDPAPKAAEPTSVKVAFPFLGAKARS